MPLMDITGSYCFWTINRVSGKAEVYGPNLALATKCAQALGGENIQPISSCENTVSFTLPQPHEG